MSRLDVHYETVRDRYDYARIEDSDLGPVSSPGLERRFVAVDNPDVLAATRDLSTLVMTGVGMTGPPHLGTVGQIRTAIALQDVGLDVQFVIADLEPYHSGSDLDRVRALAQRYRAFILDMGFDPSQGRLRTQEEARDVMHTAYILAPYYRPDEWGEGPDYEPTAWQQAVADVYVDNDAANGADAEVSETADANGPTSEAAETHSSVLHGVDFLHPLWTDEYEQVVLTFGIDEHHLTPWTRLFRDASPVEGPIAGLYTRMLPGLNGSAKMSKSVPGSGVTLDMTPETVRERIRGAHRGNNPASSPVFGAMCLASTYGPDELDALESVRETGGEEWAAAKAEYAEYVVDLAERWRRTEPSSGHPSSSEYDE